MTRDEIVLMARKADLWLTSDERIAAVVRFANLVAAAEREKIISANAPEIERINEYIKSLEEAILALRAAIEQAQRNEFNPDWDAMAVMVTEQQRMAKRIAELEAQPEQKPVAWVYPEGLAAFKSGKPWTAYGGSGDGSHSDGVQRIPLYLNDAVAPRAEPRLGGSGAGFESLPASPQWQGLTDAERGITAAEIWGSVLIAPQSYQAFARAIEAKLREKNA